eukprot:1239001-Prymnesium_polylepis.2
MARALLALLVLRVRAQPAAAVARRRAGRRASAGRPPPRPRPKTAPQPRRRRRRELRVAPRAASSARWRLLSCGAVVKCGAAGPWRRSRRLREGAKRVRASTICRAWPTHQRKAYCTYQSQ